MSEVDQESKTEKPTAKRLTDAQDRGQFAKSPEFQVLVILSGALMALSFSLGSVTEGVANYATNIFSRFDEVQLTPATAIKELGILIRTAGALVAPIMIACVIAALVAGGLQSGFHLSTKAVGFNPERLNPVTGMQRIFSKSIFVHAGIDLMKLIAIAAVLYAGARTLVMDPMFSAPIETRYLGQFMQRATFAFFTRLLLALGVIATLSYAYEKFKTQKELMMSREEVKEEAKNQEGNTAAKAAIRRFGRRLIQKQMLAAVPTADVVVTNPTHYAVALRYERGRDKAPVVLAKGENRFALRIKAIAAENGVPTVENRPVARLLFAMGKVGEAIPPELYQAVAEILAVVYRTHRYYFHMLRQRRLGAASPEKEA